MDRILEQWRRERPELDVSPMGVIGRIGRLARALAPVLEPVFREHGLKTGEFDVLAALRRSGSPYRLSPGELSDSVMLTSGAMTHRLDRLEEAGLIRRLPDPDDRRGVRVELTTKGRGLVDRAVSAHVANEQRVLASLTESERRALEDLLRKLLLSLE